MVAHAPGPWWEDVLASIGQQTYTNLSVLVIETVDEPDEPDGAARDGGDADGEGRAGAADRRPVVTDTEARLRAVLPDAHLHRVEGNPGYGPASNEAIGAIEGAAFLLLCHDDVAFDPMAVQALVEEAFRSNAGVVGPKIVDFNDPHRLLQVGMGADKFGAPAPLLDRGELDQEQHDAVRDVFYVPGGAMLVRADLFETLGGFDPGIDFIGEDLDFCWRAHVAGARVLVAPAATVAHREALEERRPSDDRRRLAFEHRLRAQLICYRRWHRWRVVPQAFVLAMIEAIGSVVLGRMSHARDVTSAWTANLANLGDIRSRRAALNRIRVIPDKEIRALQVHGSARVSAFFRGQLGSNDDRLASMAGAGRDLAASLRSSTARGSLVAWLFVLVVMAFGSRDLLTSPIPAVGEFVAFPDHPFDLLREFTSGFHAAGLGSESANPTALGFISGLGLLFFGAMGQLRRVMIVALLPLGALGMWRLARPVGSRRSRIVALVLYVAMPVATNSIAVGRWSGLIIYALSPWLINQLARASRMAPFGTVGDEAGPGVRDRPLLQRIVVLGVLTGIGVMFVPFALPIMVAMAVAMSLGGAVVGQFRGSLRMLAAAIGGAVLAFALNLPWSLELLRPEWAQFAGTSTNPSPAFALDDILRFATGPTTASWLAWAFIVTSALALLIGKRWRLAWAMRGWALALASWGAVWAIVHTDAARYLPAPEVLLAPAAVGLALASAMGMASFEVDLGDYHFGWRQIASVLSGAALVVALVPFLQTSLDGSWDLPKGDFNQVLANLDSPSANFRTLWIGDASVVPMHGWRLDAPEIEAHDEGRLVYATTYGRTPTVQELWPGSDSGATQQLRLALVTAAQGQTNRLGALLAPMGIEYIAVPQRNSTSLSARPGPPTPALLDMLGDQLDLARVELPAGITVYRNAAWGPVTARLPREIVVSQGGPALADRAIPPLAGAPDGLPDRQGYGTSAGVLPGPATIYLGTAASPRWELKVNGEPQRRTDALGWSNQFAVDATGQATLHFQTSRIRYLWLVGVALLWLVLLWYLWRTRVSKESERDLAQLREDREL
jgi:GT2 family glycosyltransferase